jgi:hypothetical protein
MPDLCWIPQSGPNCPHSYYEVILPKCLRETIAKIGKNTVFKLFPPWLNNFQRKSWIKLSEYTPDLSEYVGPTDQKGN